MQHNAGRCVQYVSRLVGSKCPLMVPSTTVHEVPILYGMTFHKIALIISALFATIATSVSGWLIFMHATHYSKPYIQRQYVRVSSSPATDSAADELHVPVSSESFSWSRSTRWSLSSPFVTTDMLSISRSSWAHTKLSPSPASSHYSAITSHRRYTSRRTTSEACYPNRGCGLSTGFRGAPEDKPDFCARPGVD